MLIFTPNYPSYYKLSFLLQIFPPTTKYPSYYKVSLLLKKVSLLLQIILLTTNYTSYIKQLPLTNLTFTQFYFLLHLVTEANLCCVSGACAVYMRDNQKRYVTAGSDGSANSNANSAGATETWTIVFLGNNQVNIYNANRQKYIVSENDGTADASSTTANSLETFTIQSMNFGRYAFRTNQGKYLTAENGGGFSANAISSGTQESFATLAIG